MDRRNRKIANQGKEEVIITVTVADSFSDLDLVVEAFELHPDEQRREHLCQIATAYETDHIQSVLCYKLVVRCVHVHRYRDEGII